MVTELAGGNAAIPCTFINNHCRYHLARSCHGQGDCTALAVISACAHVDGACATVIDGLTGRVAELRVCLVHIEDEPWIASWSHALRDSHNKVRLRIFVHLIWRALRRVCRNTMNKTVHRKETRDAHQTRSTGLQQEFRLQAPNLAHKCKTSHRHSTISPFRHKGNEFLLNIIQESRRASMVGHGIIATLIFCGVLNLKSGMPPANRLGTNLKILRSTDKGDTIFLHSPINKGNNGTPLG
jgi:hypothetical protein